MVRFSAFSAFMGHVTKFITGRSFSTRKRKWKKARGTRGTRNPPPNLLSGVKKARGTRGTRNPPPNLPSGVMGYLITVNPIMYHVARPPSAEVLNQIEDYEISSYAARNCLHSYWHKFAPDTEEEIAAKPDRRSAIGCIALLYKSGFNKSHFEWVAAAWPNLRARILTMHPLLHHATFWEEQYHKHADQEHESLIEYLYTTMHLYEDFCEKHMPGIFPPPYTIPAFTHELRAWNNANRGGVYYILNIFFNKSKKELGIFEVWCPVKRKGDWDYDVEGGVDAAVCLEGAAVEVAPFVEGAAVILKEGEVVECEDAAVCLEGAAVEVAPFVEGVAVILKEGEVVECAGVVKRFYFHDDVKVYVFPGTFDYVGYENEDDLPIHLF